MTSKKRKYRTRLDGDDEEDDHDGKTSVREKLKEVKERQKFRARPRGISQTDLAFDVKMNESIKDVCDTFNLRKGGLLNINTVKDRDRDRSGEGLDKDVTSLGNNFSQETNRRDEDVEMLRYIDQELAKRKGKERRKEEVKRVKSKEDMLYEVPDQINFRSKVMKSEEMLSNQMLSGIPEVDLGIHAKMVNIEATEEAKGRLLNEMRSKKIAASDFVPINLASNFLLHERFYNEQKVVEAEKQKERVKREGEALYMAKNKGPSVEVTAKDGDSESKEINRERKQKVNDEASDDYLYDKFKKKTSDSWRYQ